MKPQHVCKLGVWKSQHSPGGAKESHQGGRSFIEHTSAAPCSPIVPVPAPAPAPGPDALTPGPAIGQFRAVAPASGGACTVQYIQVCP